MPTSTSLKLANLSYVIIYVSDTDKALTFYRDTLGMTVKVSHPGWVELETGATTLALHGSQTPPSPQSERQACMVFHVDDVRAAAAELQNRGITLKEEPRQVCEEGDKVGISADFTDLDGNLLSIFSLEPRQ